MAGITKIIQITV